MPLPFKICGLSTPETVDASVAAGAAWVGFVLFPPSPRDIAPERMAGLIARLPDRVVPVAVMVNPEPDRVDRAVAAGVRAIQLHGGESPAQAAALRRPGVELWKAVPVRTRADLDTARAFKGVADRIVYDAKTPAGTLPGGMGLRFDWRLLDGFAHPLPWLLSGGLDAANLAEAVGVTGARAVDLSSGVEDAPGAKSVDKIAALGQAAARL
jgi:phosphoribosylanthranilate isomerase